MTPPSAEQQELWRRGAGACPGGRGGLRRGGPSLGLEAPQPRPGPVHLQALSGNQEGRVGPSWSSALWKGLGGASSQEGVEEPLPGSP